MDICIESQNFLELVNWELISWKNLFKLGRAWDVLVNITSNCSEIINFASENLPNLSGPCRSQDH